MIRSFTLLCLLLSAALPAAAQDAYPRTEDHPRCVNYTETRQPLFGQLHLHTQYSSDAAVLATRNTPADAYKFAKGGKVGLAPFYDTRVVKVDDSKPPVGGVAQHPYCLPSEMPPGGCQFTASREIRLPEGRALDFTAVTDHSEYLGETNICFFEGGAACQTPGQSQGCDTGQVCGSGLTCVPIGYDSPSCVAARGNVSRLNNGIGAAQFVNVWQNPEPPNPPFQYCNETLGAGGATTCVFQAQNVWQQTIAAAEDAYDKTDQCTFTSFIAYEYTSMPQMSQCTETFDPCLDTADCNQDACPRNNPQCNTCLPPGQCSSPLGKLCFVGANDTPCDDGATCVANNGGNNLHRNIIFRNANVPDRPISYVDVPTGCGAGAACQGYDPFAPGGAATATSGPLSTQSGTALGSPTVMLETLEKECNRKDPKKPCDFLSIPHNSNLSGGAMFLLPETERDAEVRHDRERLVEIFQIKGDSECRYSRLHPLAWQPGAFAADELCGFEDMSYATLAAAMLVHPDERSIPASSYVRNALKSGLKYQRENGINPFKLGFVGSLDNHNGTPTETEVDYSKYGAHGDNSFAAGGQMLVETLFLGLETNGGGLTVAWAEENTRDSIFEAFERRETYATSGTRPIVRFFGGFDLPDDMCETGDFAARGYEHGQPMGGTLTPARGVPKFAVSALMDAGWEGHPGATLQRVQIVKGWVDARGEVREKVFDVAGSDEVAPVDLETCTPANLSASGHPHLCTVWRDKEFDPKLNAFYYARVLENPSCRWNQYYCLDRGVDCSKPPQTGKDLVGYNAYEYEVCCGHEVPKAVQQRAWTSPIWYEP